MTEEEIDAAVDELMAFAEEQGRRLREATATGQTGQRDPRVPDVSDWARAELRRLVRRDMKQFLQEREGRHDRA